MQIACPTLRACVTAPWSSAALNLLPRHLAGDGPIFDPERSFQPLLQEEHVIDLVASGKHYLFATVLHDSTKSIGEGLAAFGAVRVLLGEELIDFHGLETPVSGPRERAMLHGELTVFDTNAGVIDKARQCRVSNADSDCHVSHRKDNHDPVPGPRLGKGHVVPEYKETVPRKTKQRRHEEA